MSQNGGLAVKPEPPPSNTRRSGAHVRAAAVWHACRRAAAMQPHGRTGWSGFVPPPPPPPPARHLRACCWAALHVGGTARVTRLVGPQHKPSKTRVADVHPPTAGPITSATGSSPFVTCARSVNGGCLGRARTSWRNHKDRRIRQKRRNGTSS